MDKKDLDELDRMEYEREQEQFEKYGMDLRKVNRKVVAKKNKKIAKFLRGIGYFIKRSAIAFFVIVILLLLAFLCFLWGGLYVSTNVNVKEQMEAQYSLELKLLGKDTSGRTENGKYYFETKNEPHIKFTAEKFFGNASSDYLDQITKYYFELWNSPNKKYFVVVESTEDDMLNYELSLDYRLCKDIDEAAEIYVEFIRFCGDSYKPYWDVFIRLDDDANNRIYPYVSMDTTHEDAIKNVKDLYNKHIEFMKNAK